MSRAFLIPFWFLWNPCTPQTLHKQKCCLGLSELGSLLEASYSLPPPTQTAHVDPQWSKLFATPVSQGPSGAYMAIQTPARQIKAAFTELQQWSSSKDRRRSSHTLGFCGVGPRGAYGLRCKVPWFGVWGFRSVVPDAGVWGIELQALKVSLKTKRGRGILFGFGQPDYVIRVTDNSTEHYLVSPLSL